MNSISHFYNLSLKNKLNLYMAVVDRDPNIRVFEKMDGVFIAFRFTYSLDQIGFPSFPPHLEFRSNNSPWVRSGKEYLNWAKPAKFSFVFAAAIEQIRADHDFISKILSEMIRTKQDILSAELLFPELMENGSKMIRTSYNMNSKYWRSSGGLYFFFHQPGLSLQGSPELFWNWTPDTSNISSLIGDSTIEECISRRNVNFVRRQTLAQSLDLFFLELASYWFSMDQMEGIVIRWNDVIAKVVNPKFMTWELNQNLFEKEV